MTMADYCSVVLPVQEAPIAAYRDLWERNADLVASGGDGVDLSSTAKDALDNLNRDSLRMPEQVQQLLVDEAMALVPAVTGGDPDWDAYDDAARAIERRCFTA